MPEYLVEVYVPRTDPPDAGDGNVRAAAAEATGVRYRGSIFVPDEETCFVLFEAESADAVRDAAALAQLPFDRVSAAFSEGMRV
jgi:hypothetical protein